MAEENDNQGKQKMIFSVDSNICKKSIKTFGKDDTINNAMTEPAELIQAIGKIREAEFRNITGCYDLLLKELASEMADTMIVICNLMEIYGITEEELIKRINFKQERQVKRCESYGKRIFET